jgi:glycosyltransferase involved in cell wall biosynthesis
MLAGRQACFHGECLETDQMTLRPMRLLTVGHSYVVGLNRRLPDEIARASRGSWQVTVVAPRFVRSELRDIALEPSMTEACRVEGVDFLLSRHLHVAAFGLKLRELLHRDWDLVHIFQDLHLVAGWQSAYWTPENIPLVFFVNQSLVKKYPPPFSWMEKYCLRRCSGWIGCGQTVVEASLTKGYGRKLYRRIGYGVDTDIFKRKEPVRKDTLLRLEWDESVPVVAFLGRLVPEKGVTMLTSVLEKVSSPWRALFIGNGPLLNELQQWAMKFPGRVRLVSAAHDEVAAYLSTADVLCAPSQTTPHCSEQFGRMIIEAFAAGVTVVGSDSGEIPYVIGNAGIVLGEKDEAAWVSTLDRLLSDRALRSELAAKGRNRAEEQFAWPVIAHQHLEFFDQILSNDQNADNRISERIDNLML